MTRSCQPWDYLCALVFLLLALRTNVRADTVTVAPELEVSFGDKHQRALLHIVDFGRIVVGTSKEIALNVRNVTSERRAISVTPLGPGLRLKWDGENEEAGRATLEPWGSRVLTVNLEFSDASVQPLRGVAFRHESRTLTWVVFDYALFAKEEIYMAISTPGLASAAGTDYGPWYRVCSGPSPEGYYLRWSNFSMNNVVGDSLRGCYSWGECMVAPQNLALGDKGTCWQFRIQGEEAKDGKSARYMKAYGVLEVKWTLISSTPFLTQPKADSVDREATVLPLACSVSATLENPVAGGGKVNFVVTLITPQEPHDAMARIALRSFDGNVVGMVDSEGQRSSRIELRGPNWSSWIETPASGTYSVEASVSDGQGQAAICSTTREIANSQVGTSYSLRLDGVLGFSNEHAGIGALVGLSLGHLRMGPVIGVALTSQGRGSGLIVGIGFRPFAMNAVQVSAGVALGSPNRLVVGIGYRLALAQLRGTSSSR